MSTSRKAPKSKSGQRAAGRAKPAKAGRRSAKSEKTGMGTPNRERVRSQLRRRYAKSPLSDWVLVRTKTGCENWARLNCEQQDMKTYYPRCEIPTKAKLQPMFPGYLFVMPGDKWRQLRHTYGVLDIVMQGDRPAFVPHKVMKELKARENKEGFFVLDGQRTPDKGDWVQIQKGAFVDFSGIYDGLNAQGRAEVLLDIFGKVTKIELSKMKYLKVVEPPKHDMKSHPTPGAVASQTQGKGQRDAVHEGTVAESRHRRKSAG